MVINFRLGDVVTTDPGQDAMGRSWWGYDPDRSKAELWAQNRGVYGLGTTRLEEERYASLSYRGEVLLVAEITGWEPFTDPGSGVVKKALVGDVLDESHPVSRAFRAQTVPAVRNPVGYFDDEDWGAGRTGVAGTDASAGASAAVGSEGATDAPRRAHSGGQGWQSDPERRKQVEDAAQDRLMAHFVEQGYEVEDTRFGNSYDAVARRADEVVYLEAKGTETVGAAVLVSAGEVEHARSHPGQCVMGVLSDIRFDADGVLDPGSAEFRMLPFEPAAEALTPTGYRWSLPGVAG